MPVTSIKRRMVHAAAAVLALSAGLMFTAPAANAATPTPEVKLRNLARADQGVSIQGTDRNYGKAYEYSINLSRVPVFTVSRNGDGTYSMRERDKSTHRCLDSNGAGAVYGTPCNGGAYQHWRFNFKGTAKVGSQTVNLWQIVDKATGRCLDANGQDVYTGGCNPGNYQRWIMAR